MGIEIFAIVDTDCNPDYVTHSIPGNDDAVRSIRLITSRLANAALEGLAQREAMLEAERAEMELAEQEALMLSEQEEEALAGAAAMAEGDDSPVDSELAQAFSQEDFTDVPEEAPIAAPSEGSTSDSSLDLPSSEEGEGSDIT